MMMLEVLPAEEGALYGGGDSAGISRMSPGTYVLELRSISSLPVAPPFSPTTVGSGGEGDSSPPAPAATPLFPVSAPVNRLRNERAILGDDGSPVDDVVDVVGFELADVMNVEQETLGTSGEESRPVTPVGISSVRLDDVRSGDAVRGNEDSRSDVVEVMGPAEDTVSPVTEPLGEFTVPLQ